MLAHVAAAKLIDFRDEAVEKLAVVADDDGRAVKGADGLLEHVLGGHVEVVGGLVEDEKVDWLEQELNHGQTTALATRKHLHLLVDSLASKHE